MSLLNVLLVVGLIVGSLLILLGLFAGRRPFLDLANQGRALVLIGSVVVLGLALLAGDGWLIAAAILVMLANIGLFALGLRGQAPRAKSASQRFLRLVTFNVWKRNPHIEDIAAFLDEADADLVVLQEVTNEQKSRLRDLTKARYPQMLGTNGLLILAKHKERASGHIDGAKIDGWARTPFVLWAQFEIEGVAFELAGVHLAYPFNPLEQVADTETLIAFVRSRKAPLLVAGDFNLTPWSRKLQRFTRETGLLRYNTFRPTWPMRRVIPLIPLVGLDNVFSSSEFARLSVATGSSAGSDHLPIIADIALAEPPPSSTK
jgi:endonuclease/exonuclease/phosphatase (EEP) superfamily protein YafD